MFAAMNNPAAAYSKVGVETGIEAANSHKLILMLFDGAMLAVSTASLHMRRNEEPGDIAKKGEAISKAINIIMNGLKASLDVEAGGELAQRLSFLYEYMCARLFHANLKNDEAALKEVARLLAELKSAWEEIADDPAVLSANRAAA